MQTPNAIAIIGIATIPNISARGSDATHSVKGLGRGSSGFAAMGRSPIRSPQFLNVDLVLLFFATVRRVITACPLAASRRLGPLKKQPRVSSSATTTGNSLRMSITRTSRGGDPRPSCSPKMRRDGSRQISQSCRSYCDGTNGGAFVDGTPHSWHL